MCKIGLRILLLAPVALTAGWTFAPFIKRPFQTVNHMPSSPLYSSSTPEEETMGLNELQTLLRNAALKEDFIEAGRLSDLLIYRMAGDNPPKSEEEIRILRLRMSWSGLGAAPWLVDRLDALNYTFPTTIQINSMEAVNAILDVPDEIMEVTT